MTLDEAIAHAEERGSIGCSECAREHLQLAQWLKELKELRKYAWHDLRKNPEDLPNTTREVNITFEDLEENSGFKYYDVAFFGESNEWYSSETENFSYKDKGFNVIAWCEIKPYEEVTE